MIRVSDDIDAALAIRRKVFIEEQGISFEDDVDGNDAGAIHLLAFDDGRPVGTARLLMSGEVGKIGRVAVLKDERGRGFGRELVEFAVATLRERGAARAMLGAQLDSVGFYERLSFSAFGPQFIDAGLPHQEMVREL